MQYKNLSTAVFFLLLFLTRIMILVMSVFPGTSQSRVVIKPVKVIETENLRSFVENTQLPIQPLENNRLLKHKIAKQTPGLDYKVLTLALNAYEKLALAKQVKKPILSIVDYSVASNQPRFWIIDLEKQHVKYILHVSHGRGSGRGKFPTFFSNKPQSFASSLGIFLTGKPYMGRHGKSLRLMGLEQKFNSKAYARHVVVHGARYATAAFAKKYGYLGHSQGCLAIDTKYAAQVIHLIKEGSVIFAYYPHKLWLNQSRYVL